MRAFIALAALASLSACQTAREIAGAYKQAADKGVTFSVGDTPAPAEATDARGQPLPGGLVGDTANRRYTTDGAPPK